MSYAVRKDGLGWRAVNGPEDVGPDETYSETQPEPVAPDPKAAILAQITQLETQTLLPRVTREFMLTAFAAQAAAAGADPMTNFGYRKVKELDDQIAALRAQI